MDIVEAGIYFKYLLLTRHALALVFSSCLSWEISLKKVNSFALAFVSEFNAVKKSLSLKSETGFRKRIRKTRNL